MTGGVNLYVYCNRDPNNRTDRLGSDWEFSWDPSEWSPWEFTKEQIAPRAVGGLKVVGGAAAFYVGAGLCETGVGCVVGGPLAVLGADVAASGVGQVVTGKPQPTAIGSIFGPKAQDVQEDLVNAAGMVGSFARPYMKWRTGKDPFPEQPTPAPRTRVGAVSVGNKQLDNSILSSLADPKNANHAAAVAYITGKEGALYANRAAYMEFLGAHSKYDFELLAKRYGIKLLREISIEELSVTSIRLRNAFAESGRVLSDTDAMNAAGAFLRGETFVTSDYGAARRAMELGIKVEYVGSAEKAAKVGNNLQPVSPPVAPK